MICRAALPLTGNCTLPTLGVSSSTKSTRSKQMENTGDRTIQVKRRIIVALVILPFFSGFAAFMNILRDPRFQDIRGLDVVRLIAIGACWGVAVAGLALLLGSKLHKS
jgi:hypothetical protein